MTSREEFKIAIVGAGPAGTTLARLLQLAGFKQVKIYERETSSNVRSQGGTLDLHQDTGLAAIKACGLFESFQKHARYDEEGMKIMDKHGKIHFNEYMMGPPEEARPEIDRGYLRQILLDSLQPNTVQYGKTLLRVESIQGSNYKHKLIFKDGSESEEIDLIVGADGAWSRVKECLENAPKPVYAGLQMIDLTITKPSPELLAEYGAGMVFILSPGQGVLMQRNSGSVLRLYFACKVDENVSLLPNDASFTTIKSTVLDLFKGWTDDIPKIIDQCDENAGSRLWKMYAIPPGARWKTRAGVTLIGDSAHLMTPFAGEGVNMAMADALELVKALEYAFPKDGSKLIAHDDSSLTQLLHWTLSSFEAKMQHRTKSYAIESADNLSRCFDDPNAPEMFVEYVKSFGPPSVKTLVSIGTMAACAVAFVSMVLSRHWHL